MLANVIGKLIGGLLLVAMMMAAAFYFQFYNYNLAQQVVGKPQLSFLEYARYSYDLTLAQQKTRQAEASFAVGNALPAAPEGWTRSPYTRAHGKLLTGKDYKIGAVAFGHEHVVQIDYLRAANQNNGKVAVGYVKGASIIGVRIEVQDTAGANTAEDAVAEHLDKIVAAEEAANGPKGQIVMNGFTLNQVSNPRGGSKGYRSFKANIGGQIDIFVVSNATDAEIALVMRSTDIEMLKAHAGVRNDNAPPAPPRPGGDQLAANMDGATAGLSAEEAALAGAVTAKLGADAASDKGFMSRLKTFLLQSGAEQEEEIEKPVRAVCKKKKGFKHCVFPKEEDE